MCAVSARVGAGCMGGEWRYRENFQQLSVQFNSTKFCKLWNVLFVNSIEKDGKPKREGVKMRKRER